MIWYHLIFSDNKKAVGYAWNLMGFVAKLAQGVSRVIIVCRLGAHADDSSASYPSSVYVSPVSPVLLIVDLRMVILIATNRPRCA